ncbi:MAG: hypothetical protein AVDCRST_MAG38-2239 [uncultured Solirubrobacteraceae bacterium]|uniref:Uncharacterized protein n=1 Tax=uncultured Solirubrobacteraceae bacterium TaxID=1162706 RepID=A0A6J4S3L2_9ACTN|nr:MAG: hypothetical protein AVDCRST_MAG38-2239 [uncultured Solirubrobacteraceae bacterium]
MGLLDDAIREHLELKRQHGAPDEEVKRQEHEALGPIRRRGEPDPDAAIETPAGAVPAGAQPEAPGDEPGADVEVTAAGEATGVVPPPPVTPADEQPVAPEPPGHEPVIEDFPAADGPAAVPAGTSGRASFVDDEPWIDESPGTPPDDILERPSQETAAFSAADVADAAGEPAPADEDVLEETPDFLQETPEHDRLWFEQRPPRGFDFEQ